MAKDQHLLNILDTCLHYEHITQWVGGSPGHSPDICWSFDRDEMEVLFTLLAERYERRSVLNTTTLVFSAWEHIFKDPMTTLAAADRVAHMSSSWIWLTSLAFVPRRH